MLTKTKSIDQITADNFGNIMYRETTSVMEDEVELSKGFHRRSLSPGQDLTGIDSKVAAIARATWTPATIAPFTAQVTAAIEAQATARATLEAETAAHTAAKETAETAKAVAEAAKAAAQVAADALETENKRVCAAKAAQEATVTTVTSVTMRQARLALLGAGLLDDVTAAIAALPEPDRTAATIEFEYAGVVERNSGLIPSMATALGMTGAQLDALFATAKTL